MTSPDSLPATDLPEGDFARLLGIGRDDLKKIRATLVPGLHWNGGTGKPALYTITGQQQVAILLAEKKDAPPVEAAYHTLVVTRVTSARTLLAEKKDAPPGELLRVLVRDSKHFLPGMEIGLCEASDATPGVFYYHGRLPRRRGHL